MEKKHTMVSFTIQESINKRRKESFRGLGFGFSLSRDIKSAKNTKELVDKKKKGNKCGGDGKGGDGREEGEERGEKREILEGGNDIGFPILGEKGEEKIKGGVKEDVVVKEGGG